jgi:hypothetical protein
VDVFVRREGLRRFQWSFYIVGGEKVLKLTAALTAAVMLIPFRRCVLDSAVLAFELPISFGIFWHAQSMFNPVSLAGQFETHLCERHDILAVPLRCKLDAFLRHSLKEVFRQLSGRLGVGFLCLFGSSVYE